MIFYKTECHVTQTDVLQHKVSDINKVICYNRKSHRLISLTNFNAQFLYFITICMLQ